MLSRPRSHAMSCGVAAAAMLVGASIGALPAAGAATAPKPPPFVIGDSVMAWSTSIFVKEVQRQSPGAVFDVASCRGVMRSCVAPMVPIRPPSGLETLRARRGHLGSVVVIALGYNDLPQRWSIDHVMSELRSQRVGRVIWVNLSERRPAYHATNQALDQALSRWRELRVLDWRTVSATHDDWFLDGVHLTKAGKIAFGRFLADGLKLFV